MAKKSKNAILKQLSKKLPEGSFFTLNEQEQVDVIPSGISVLDYASSIGGWPRGWMSMIYGVNGSGKSALCYASIGNYQKTHPDSLCAIVDLEKSASPAWMEKFGVDPERVIIVRPATIDEACTMSMQLVEAGSFDIIVIDSLGAGILKVEVENDKSRVAGSAGAITRLCKSLNSAFITLERQIKIKKDEGEDASDITVPAILMINQARASMNSPVPMVTYSGGYSLGHTVAMNIYLRASGKAEDKIKGTVDGAPMQVGTRCIGEFKKNKLGCPNKQFGVNFVWQECPEEGIEFGMDNAQSIADLCLTLGIAEISGKTVIFPVKYEKDKKITDKIVGRKNFTDKIRQDKELQDFLAEEISRIMAKEAKDEDLEALKQQNPFN